MKSKIIFATFLKPKRLLSICLYLNSKEVNCREHRNWNSLFAAQKLFWERICPLSILLIFTRCVKCISFISVPVAFILCARSWSTALPSILFLTLCSPHSFSWVHLNSRRMQRTEVRSSISWADASCMTPHAELHRVPVVSVFKSIASPRCSSPLHLLSPCMSFSLSVSFPETDIYREQS